MPMNELVVLKGQIRYQQVGKPTDFRILKCECFKMHFAWSGDTDCLKTNLSLLRVKRKT